VIADQHQLPVRPFDVLEQLGQLPGGGHAGLVDNQHARPGQWRRVAEVVKQRGGAGRFNARARSQLAGPAARDRDAQHRVAGLLPRLSSGRERERLPGSGFAGHDHDPLRGATDVVDHLLLLARQRWPPRDRGRDRASAGLWCRRFWARGGAVDELLFAGQQLRG